MTKMIESDSMKSYDEFITEVSAIWLEMLREDAPQEVIGKFSEDELQALAEYMAKSTFRLYSTGAAHGYSISLMDEILERDLMKGKEV